MTGLQAGCQRWWQPQVVWHLSEDNFVSKQQRQPRDRTRWLGLRVCLIWKCVNVWVGWRVLAWGWSRHRLW